ncbi:Disease resistance protein TAO1 [Camellia lanceoleosa]|uniref:Disease resistance protein TAO1 n=1 Tax=Camellia lanceoleosa TaxID=1840588 RepID=A0ACC0G3Z1_9ERIC|nr:Disease resistance protein TAO1 [Camellia lanceoleosa]
MLRTSNLWSYGAPKCLTLWWVELSQQSLHISKLDSEPTNGNSNAATKGTRSIEGITLNFEKNCDLSLKNIYWMNFRRWPGLASATAYLKEIYNKSFGDCVENENNVILSTKAFEPMVNLRLLQINHVSLDGSFNHFCAELKWLQWKGCPLKTLPAEFFRLDLTVLDLSKSKMVQIWNRKWWRWHKNKMAKKLLVMNLSDCYYLTHIPDLSMLPLEKLILERCKGLVKIHESIGDMSTLTHLNMKDCSSLEEFLSDVSGLKNLENFILHGCSKLKALPENLSGLKSIRELDIDCTAIVNLPDSIFHLKKLERFSLKNCESLKQLPPTLGKLSSLLELYLDGSSALEEVPDSVGNLTNLEKLSLRGCGLLTSIPDSIGNLKSLIELFLDNTSIEELPASVGFLSHLKMFSVERLASLKLLRLVGTPITEVPDQIGSLNALEKLELENCEKLRSLPNSIGNLLNLTTLSLDDTIIIELPQSIGMLERLDMLKLNNCKYLRRLPSSIGRMTSLRYCLMKGTVVAELPEEFGMLSSLRILDMAKCSHPEQPQNIGGISEAKDLPAQDNLKPIVLPTSFLNLSLLETLDLSAWKLSGKIPDDFENLTSLNNLNLSHNNFCSLPSSLRGVSLLKKLTLNHCKQLKFLPTLPSSLVYLTVANCTALESVPNLSNLESLQNLDLTNCKKVMDIPGLEYLKSLRRFYIIGCNACSTAVKKGLTKVSLRHIRFLGIPENQIPDWFVPEIPCFSTQKNRDLKGVIVAVVVSLDQQQQDDFRDKVPGIVDIQLKIFRPNEPAYNDKPIHSTVLDLRGIPDTDEDHLYLCRFHDYNPFVRILKDGDKIQVTMRSPRPRFNGLELKKYGIYLVYENDDDIEDDDVESQESVTERLSKFFRSL